MKSFHSLKCKTYCMKSLTSQRQGAIPSYTRENKNIGKRDHELQKDIN